MAKAGKKSGGAKLASPKANKRRSAKRPQKRISPPSSATKKSAVAWPPLESPTGPLDILDLVRRVLMAHDMLFLSRQVSYYITASKGITEAWGDPELLRIGLSRLLEHIVKRSPRGSRIQIFMNEFALRSGTGVELKLSCTDRYLEQRTGKEFMRTLFEGGSDPQSGISLTDCRDVLVRQNGRLWVDLPKYNQPTYHIVLPATLEVSTSPGLLNQTFRYDIAVSNYAAVRKRFGIKKSLSLLDQIEHYVRSLVRYPMDMVMAAGDKGVITTIYETQQGSAQSLASRISERLGREQFRIGKRAVELFFTYNLSPLTSSRPEAQKGHHKRGL